MKSTHTPAAASTSLEAPASPRSTDRRDLLRVAGIGALVSAVAYGLQPVVVLLVSPPGSDVDFPDVADLRTQRWQAPLQAVIFVLVGAGLLVAVLAIHRLLVVRGTGITALAGTIGGVVAAVSWVLLVGSGLGQASSVGLALGKATADPAIQRAVIQGGSIAAWGFVSSAAIGSAAWLAVLGRDGRRSGLIGLPMTILCWVALAAVVVPMLVWSQAGGVLLMIPFQLALGVRLLLRSGAERRVAGS